MTDIEKKVIIACQNGDYDKFALLYDMYFKKIYDFVYYKTSHKETAEDIVSLVFMKALNKVSTFNLEAGTFQAWLYQIARNSIIDHYRAKKTDVNIEDVWDIDDGTNIQSDMDFKIQLDKVAHYLKQLNSEQRDIVIMRVWQGLSHSEIAEALGKTEASVKMKYSRAIKSIRKNLPLSVYIFLLCF